MSQGLRQAWRAQLAQPLQFVRDECIEAGLLGAVNGEQVAALLRQPRFQGRIGELLASYYGLLPLAEAGDQVEDADLAVLLLPPERFARLPLFCGACWHATALSREIRGSVVQALKARLGSEVFAFAVTQREAFAGGDARLQGDALLAAIEEDGEACVSAWLDAQAPALQAWLRLRFEVPARLAEGPPSAPQLVRRVAAQLPGSAVEGAA
ncbi:type III secretion protein [Phytopseudomonas dryadis]|uniref:Type III secretion protein n=1 Tax=Phytopseudomonas dryadis TaxID=2487520 RepID=A0A4Q9QZK3_9GAMM|nr:type III secretion protein [Pseudomonas dryadis]TBU91574.1 type III secretion protein [Pseudomonas dryadis]